MLSIHCRIKKIMRKFGKNPERITKIKHFIGKYNWERINYVSEKDDRKKFEKDYQKIDVNVLHAKTEKNISSLRFRNHF